MQAIAVVTAEKFLAAIANMTVVAEQFRASPQIFMIVLLVGAFFIDIANAFVIGEVSEFY